MAIARAGLQQIRCPLHIHVTSAAVTAVSSGASAIGIAASRTSTVRAAGTTAGTVVSGTAVDCSAPVPGLPLVLELQKVWW